MNLNLVETTHFMHSDSKLKKLWVRACAAGEGVRLWITANKLYAKNLAAVFGNSDYAKWLTAGILVALLKGQEVNPMGPSSAWEKLFAKPFPHVPNLYTGTPSPYFFPFGRGAA